MADDEDFEQLCKSLEADCGGEEADVVRNEDKDTSDVIGEIDDFIDGCEDVNNIKMNKSTIEVSVTSQNNLDLSKKSMLNQSLNSQCPYPISAISPHYLPDPLANHWSEIAPTLANLPEDQARPVEQVDKLDGLDLSLLDKEEWEDDLELEEFNMSDILNELKEHLLDESDEEDENIVYTHCHDVSTAQSEPTDVDVKSKSSSFCKRDIMSLESTSRETEERYYKQLEEVWLRYLGQEGVGKIPSRNMMVRPRIYKNNGRVVGYETLQEYVDNNHPLWGAHRQVFKEVLFKQREKGDLVRWVSKQWGNQQANTTRNLTVFSRGGLAGITGGEKGSKIASNLENAEVVKGKNGTMNIQEARATLVDMFANSGKVDGIKETEEARWKLFDAALKKKLVEAEALRNGCRDINQPDCDLCGPVCLCMVGMKRKAGTEDKVRRVSKQQFKEMVMANSSKKGWTVARTADVLYGVEESYDLQGCYTNNSYLSREQVSELTSLEDVHDMMTEIYDSPYKRDNEEEAGTWSNQLLEDY